MKTLSPKTGKKGGFTLIELLVTLSIFVILSGLILANNRKFGNSTSVTGLAYDIALSVRQAQTYGFAVKAASSGGTNNFGNASGNLNYFGIHFDVNSPSSYLIFADLASSGAPNGHYDGSTELLSTYKLNNGFTIKDICVVNDAATPSVETCHGALGANVQTLDIIFKRPDPDATLQFYTSGGTALYSAGNLPLHVRVKIQSSDGTIVKAVDILKSGQISVEDAT